MHELLNYLTQSLDDFLLSRSEKRALKNIISEKSLNRRETDWLRSQIFDLVRERIPKVNSNALLNWLEEVNKILLPSDNTKSEQSKVYFSPGEDCLNCIMEQIGFSVRTIDICVFTISDNRIRDKLDLAYNRKVKIRIITDDDKSFDKGSDIQTLSRKGIDIRIDDSPHHMHHKFALFDNKRVITGSYNWTRSAAVYNQENILLNSDKYTVSRYKEEFERLWSKMKAY